MRKWMLITLFWLLCATSALAQSTPTPATIHAPVTIDFAQVFINDSGEVSLQVRGSKASGCDLPVQIESRFEGDTLIINLYEDVPFDLICTMMLVAYEDSLPLDIVPADLPAHIIVNGVEAARVGGESAGQGAAPNGFPEPGRIDTVIEDVQLDYIESVEVPDQGPTAPGWVLTISGYQPDSCEYPVVIDQHFELNWWVIEIYREVPANVRCAGATVPYSTTITLTPDQYPTVVDPTIPTPTPDYRYTLVHVSYVLEVNDFVGIITAEINDGVTTGTITQGRRQRAIVEIASYNTAVSSADYVSIDVWGYFPDGCEGELRARRERSGTELRGDIYRIVTAETCPDVVSDYSGSLIYTPEEFGAFDPGVYAYDMNGVAGAFSLDPEEVSADVAHYRAPHAIENVSLDVDANGNWLLNVQGRQTDTCDYPVQVDVRQDVGWVVVDIYRNIPANVRCARDIGTTMALYETSIPLDADIILGRSSGDTSASDAPLADNQIVIEVNDWVGLAFALPDNQFQLQQGFREPVIINSATIMSLDSEPAQLQLDVSGQMSSGCTWPVRVKQERDGFNISVQIYRIGLPAAACPAMLITYEDSFLLDPGDGGFVPGTYTVTINGVEFVAQTG